MAFLPPVLFFDILGGYNAQVVDDLQQDRKRLELVTATDVLPDTDGRLAVRPGFSAVRSTALSGAPSITGMFHMGSQADELILTASDGTINRDNANPPGAIVGGTALTSGANVLTRGDVGAAVLVIVSSSRNVPQQVTTGVVRSDLAGTPPRGIDFKWFGRRPFMLGPSDGTTTYADLTSFGSTDDSATAWTASFTTNFLNFGRPNAKDVLIGMETYQDTLMVFSSDNVYRVYQTPNSTLPFAYQAPLFSEPGGGPPSAHAVVKGGGRLLWISQNFDVKELRGDQVRSVGYPIQPYLRGLSDSRRAQTVGGWEPQFQLACWAVSNGSDTQNKNVIAYHPATGQFYLQTLQRNAFANRFVSSQLRLIGGDYAGLFYNEFQKGQTTGSLQSATGIINGTIQTPPLHWGLPGVLKKMDYIMLEFSPVGTESVTVQYALDDSTTFTSFTESPAVITGTNVQRFFFPTPFFYERITLKVFDNTSGERWRLMRIAVPKPRTIRAEIS